MKPIRQKKVLLASLIGAAAAVAALAVLGAPLLRERWWIYRLGSEAFLDRNEACAALGRIGTAGTVPVLFAMLVMEATTSPPWERRCSRDVIPFYASAAVIYWDALREIGEPAVPRLVKALQSGDAAERPWAADLLGAIAGEEVARALEAQGKLQELIDGDYVPDPVPPSVDMAVNALVESLGTDDEALAAQIRESLSTLRQASAPAVLEALAKGQDRTREAAALVLVNMDGLDATALAALKKACGDPNPVIRQTALSARWRAYQDASLSREEGEASPSLDAERISLEILLAEQLSTADWERRAEVLALLDELKPWAAETTRKVLASLKDPDYRVRSAAESAIDDKVSPEIAMPFLVECLRDPTLEVRRSAVHAIAAFGHRGAEAVPRLTPLFDEESLRDVLEVILADMGAPAVTALLASLNDGNSAVRLGAASAISRMAALSSDEKCAPFKAHREKALAVLEKHLETEGGRDSADAAQALGIVSVSLEESLARIEALVSSETTAKRLGAVRALAVCGDREPEAAARILLKALGDSDADVRASAARALGTVHGEPGLIVTALVRALDDPESDEVIERAAAALFRKGLAAAPAAPRLEILLRESHSAGVRAEALLTLQSIHQHGLSAFAPALRVALRDGDSRVGYSILEAIKFSRGKPGAASLAPVLLEALKAVKHDSARASELLGYLHDVGGWNAEAVPVLLEKLQGAADAADEDLQAALTEAIASIGKRDASQLPVIIAFLEHEEVQLRIVRVLGRIGPAAKAVAPKLRCLARNGPPALQVEATWALEAVEMIESPATVEEEGQE